MNKKLNISNIENLFRVFEINRNIEDFIHFFVNKKPRKLIEYLIENKIKLIKNIHILKIYFPEVNQITDEKELLYLLNFYNYARIIIPKLCLSKSNNHKLLEFISEFEGSNKKYITGGGATVKTKIRQIIIKKLGNEKFTTRTRKNINN